MPRDSLVEIRAVRRNTRPPACCALTLQRDPPVLAAWFGKRTAFLLRGVAMRSLARAPGRRRLAGRADAARSASTISRKSACCSRRNISTRASGRLLAERLKGDFVFLDVGASVGGYALAVAALGGPRARILAVEPLPSVFERLVYNIRQSEFANVKAVSCALERHRRRGDAVRQHAATRANPRCRIVSAEAHGRADARARQEVC